ncbi:MAG: hypothetical protein KUG57_08095 [Ilumatobacteraceae bacterium]|nr:hypothetical protein [Ilumatobacteraceae bacterium]
MRRRSTTALFSLVLAALVAGCGTFSDSNAIARVNDTELTQDDFEAQLTELGVTGEAVIALDPVRGEITRWIQSELGAAGLVAGVYNAGVLESGVTCLSAIVVGDADTAESVTADLASGTDFATVYANANIDPGLDAIQGNLPCSSTEDLAANAGQVVVDTAALASSAAPIHAASIVDPAGTEVGVVVLVFRTYEALTDEDRVLILNTLDISSQLANSIANADIYVDPRYGTFDSATGQVIGLG